MTEKKRKKMIVQDLIFEYKQKIEQLTFDLSKAIDMSIPEIKIKYIKEDFGVSPTYSVDVTLREGFE